MFLEQITHSSDQIIMKFMYYEALASKQTMMYPSL